MTKIQKTKQYDLEERTLKFSKNIIKYINSINKNLSNNEIIKQVVRSAGSIGANYIEANESLSKKDFIMRIKICRKEAKESRYWLNLLIISSSKINMQAELIQEASELMKIFGSILEKSK
jgi:four helix bundle protein